MKASRTKKLRSACRLLSRRSRTMCTASSRSSRSPAAVKPSPFSTAESHPRRVAAPQETRTSVLDPGQTSAESSDPFRSRGHFGIIGQTYLRSTTLRRTLVLLVGMHGILGEIIKETLAAEPDMEVIGELTGPAPPCSDNRRCPPGRSHRVSRAWISISTLIAPTRSTTTAHQAPDRQRGWALGSAVRRGGGLDTDRGPDPVHPRRCHSRAHFLERLTRLIA